MKIAEAVQAMADAAADFVIIGGWSAVLHGSSYITKDIDFCFARTRENCIRIAAALAPYHPRLRDLPPGLPFVWDDRTLMNGTVFTLDTNLGAIDLLADVSGLGSFDEVKKSAVRIAAFDGKSGRSICPHSSRQNGRQGGPRTCNSCLSWKACSKQAKNRNNRRDGGAAQKITAARTDRRIAFEFTEVFSAQPQSLAPLPSAPWPCPSLPN